MGIFNKRKKYEKYIDYLEAYNTELFEAWIGADTLRLSGTTIPQIIKNKVRIKKDITVNEIIECANLLNTQMLSISDVVSRFLKLVDTASEKINVRPKDKIMNGIFAECVDLQVPNLINIINQSREAAEPKLLKSAQNVKTVDEGIALLNTLFSMSLTTWKMLRLRLYEVTIHHAHYIRQKTILDKIKID